MIEHTPWTERSFPLDADPDRFPYVLERLRGTPARLGDRLGGLSVELLTRRLSKGWSIQEHAGHLALVEELWLGRLDDFDAGAAVLRPADMSNAATEEARWNEWALTGILSSFRNRRARLVERLEAMPDAAIERVAHHPRLDRPMRVLDMMVFIAEHDDQHLVRITELLREE